MLVSLYRRARATTSCLFGQAVASAAIRAARIRFAT
jgi:hypothetical protein